MIPEGWNVRPLLSTVRIANGQVSPKVEPYKSMVLVAPDHIESSTGKLLGKETAAEQGAISGKYLFDSGDIVYSKIRPYLRKAILADFSGLCSADMYPLKPAPDISSGYILATILGYRFSKYAESVSVRSGMPKINRTEMADYLLAVPPQLEQRAIATALSDVDGLLFAMDRLITKKREFKLAAMQQLLTGQIRLPGFHGEWALKKLGGLCDYVDGIKTLGGDSGYLEIGDVNVETKSYDVSQKEKLSVRGAVKVPAGTVLISTVRPTRGAIVITKSSLYVSSAFCRICPGNGLLFQLVCQPKFLAYLGENSIGGTYPTCRDETILGYESLLPNDPAEQAAIATILSDMDAELSMLIARRDKTRDLKQAMMQDLLTGRIRLV